MMWDLVFCIFACDTVPRYKDEILKIQETWGKKSLEYPTVKILFMLGEEKTDLEGDCFIHLPGVQNDYMSASYKQFLGLEYIYKHYPCRFVFICGTDTYVNIPKIMAFIGSFDPLEKLFIGGHGDVRIVENQPVYFHCGGAGILQSFACQEAFQPFIPSVMETWTQMCVNSDRHDLIAACDVALSYYMKYKVDARMVVQNDFFINCNHRGDAVDMKCYGSDTCGHGEIHPENLISCHCMTPDNFDEFTSLLETNNWFLPFVPQDDVIS